MSTKNLPIINGNEWRTPPKDIEWHYIINQVKYVEQLIKDQELAYDNDIQQTIALLARYYRNYKGFSLEKSKELVHEHIRVCFIKLFGREPMNEITDISRSIEQACSTRRYKRCHGYKPLRDFDGVSITQQEIDTIKQLDSLQEQQLLFGILCFTKMYDEMNRREGRKINHLYYVDSCVLRRCIGWKRGYEEQMQEIMSKFHDCKYIGITKNYDKFQFLSANRQPLYTERCNIVDDDGEEVLFIDNFDTLNLTWEFILGNSKIKKCECGRYFQKKCNAQKKCPLCGNTSPKIKEPKPKTRNGKRGMGRHKKKQ